MKARALLVLATIFAASLIGRIAVFAADIVDAQQKAPTPAAQENTSQHYQIDSTLAKSVKDRIIALDAREDAIADRESELKVYEQQIKKRLSDLEKANAVFSESLSTRQTERDADIAKLAAIYEGMAPEQAGTIINSMDPAFAAGLLIAMESEQAASIVAAIDPQKAYAISVILANRTHLP